MSHTEMAPGETREGQALDFKLEVVVLPVTDVDRAKRFYTSLGWRQDADFATSDELRVVQFTPPGSEASIIFGQGVTSATPGSVEDLQLTVFDIDKARDELVARGVDVTEVFHDAGGVFHHAGTEARVAGPAQDHADYGSWASFRDPDGNGWLLQEIQVRLPGRVSATTRYDDAQDLAKALRRAAAAHGQHEARTGQEDPDWPGWYAEYMVRERAGEELPT
ncbi:MAG TPA: VOC family protein [Baekduia sp.]|uniref:VOC family protein n=1 Tax=Baekduia sp. TaxID=2600305 RepID=UPI002D1D3987|nr:VOC family protein [Baekduia sp.]HMJ32601.1 VOC family protein [Baekduia sp.]